MSADYPKLTPDTKTKIPTTRFANGSTMSPMPVKLDKKSKKVKTSVSLPTDLLPGARLVSREHGISVSEYLSHLLLSDLRERLTTKAKPWSIKNSR